METIEINGENSIPSAVFVDDAQRWRFGKHALSRPARQVPMYTAAWHIRICMCAGVAAYSYSEVQARNRENLCALMTHLRSSAETFCWT